MVSVLEKAERERQERLMLNIRPKPQNADPWRQERISLKVRPMRPRRAAFDLGTPVPETEHWNSGISARQREERRLYERRLQFDEGMTSGLKNNLAETQEACANEDHPLKQSSSISSLEDSLEEIILDFDCILLCCGPQRDIHCKLFHAVHPVDHQELFAFFPYSF